jgi:hypothetical protein
VKAGDYIETNECALAVGVSIEGEGITSHIISHYKTTRNSGGILHGTISLSSSAEGTNGNQTISNLKLDGDGLQGDVGVLVLRRSNVKIHNCTIVDFYKNGITFDGCSAYTEPSIWATGNELYNNVMSNCGDADGTWDGGGIIEFGGQNGILIHDNILTETSRGQEHNGNIIDGGYYNKGTKYYRNKSYKNDYDGDVWNFHIESWNTIGGTEIYDNEFYGGDTDLDVAGDFNEKGDYLYSWYIHDNFFTGNPVQTANGKYTIDIEGASTNDIWIYRNHFLNLPVPIELSEGNPNPSEERRIYIGYNLMEKCGWNSPEYESILQFSDGFSGSVISDVYIYNNIISGDKVTHNTAISIDTVGTISNFNVKNNIILHNDNGEFFNIANSGSINGLYVDNNLLYDNANNNNPKFSGNTINNYEFLNDIRGANPLFVDENAGNFHLQSGSPAINAGINVGLTSDYEGNSIVGLPDIGAFESHY